MNESVQTSPLVDEHLSTALEGMRRRLLDISKRNPLTNTRVQARSNKQINIVDELSDQIFRILYREQKKFTFLPGHGAADEEDNPNQAEDTETIYVPDALEEELHSRHTDTKLQTTLTPEALQRSLVTLFREARTMEEDLSINVLYLALGFMKYHDAKESDVERYAPLIMLPVSLSRDSSKGLFKLEIRDEDLTRNQSFAEMLYEEHQIILPEFPDSPDWLPSEYFATVENAISIKTRWSVDINRMILRFFSFERFQMSQDLLASTVEKFGNGDGDSTALVRQLIGPQTSSGPDVSERSLSIVEDKVNLDQKFDDLRELFHILDADTSQTQVIAAALEGKSLVVQGPPGTGKSQTIANIIGAAVAQGKRVLFVAEKRAALDVVFKRLQNCGLGHLCLELHSHKANRKHFYEDLKDTLESVSQRQIDTSLFDEIQATRDQLNRMNELIHTVDEESGETPYLVMGKMSELNGKAVPPPTFEVADIESWNSEEFKERLNVLAALVELIDTHGPVREHVWYGIEKRLTPVDKNRLQALLQELPNLTQQLLTACSTTQKAFDSTAFNTVGAISQQLRNQQYIVALPAEVFEYLKRDSVSKYLPALVALHTDLKQNQDLSTKLLEDLLEPALEKDWVVEANRVAFKGKSLMRIFDSTYRNAINELKQVCKRGLPKSYDDRVALLNSLVDLYELRKKITTAEQLGREHFGLAWAGHQTPFEQSLEITTKIAEGVEHYGSIEALQAGLENTVDAGELDARHENVNQYKTSWLENFTRVVDMLGLDTHKVFNAETIEGVPLEDQVDKVTTWHTSIDALDEYLQLSLADQETRRLGLQEVAQQLDDGTLDYKLATDCVTMLRCESVFRVMLEKHPELGDITGDLRSKLVEDFKRQDQQLKQLASQEIVARHDEAMPRGHSGQMSLIRGEANKKTRHLAIRKLLDQCGEALLLIKPVFLMSPLSVSRFLQPGGLRFDLLLIDEASQVRPEQAMGAMLRAKQIVVVGDQKQMPPTSFFEKNVSGEDELGDEEDSDDLEAQLLRQAGDMESVLSLCEARGMNRAMLQWHYRSEHPSLIEVSNHEFYNNKLIYPPPPTMQGGEVGLTLVKVDGVYQRSRGRNNPIEAEETCQAVLQHVRENPTLTLGVVALSVSQRNTIQNQLDILCSEHPDLDQYCNRDGEEAFFVKNLENVQGDERDVIYVSIGYGPDDTGKFFQQLGPVSGEGGERRLNVLFTRARKKCTIFASIGHEDIRTDVSNSQGPRVLRQYLKYAETGNLDVPHETGGEEDSPFEVDVAHVLESHGYRVARQVGSVGFSIDLAVYNPDDPKNFLLAVECDGARYHSSSWARERDRLRQEVLETKGWEFHRIWSTDWFYARERQIEKMLTAIEAARLRRQGSGIVKKDTTPREEPRNFRVTKDPADDEETTSLTFSIPTQPYVEPELTEQVIDLSIASSAEIQNWIQKIVQTEGIVHQSVIERRMARMYGKSRTKKFTNFMTANLAEMVKQGMLRRDSSSSPFYSQQESDVELGLRDRSTVSLDELKDPDCIPLVEIEQAVLAVVNECVSIGVDDCAREIGKLLGTNRKRDRMKVHVEKVAERLAESDAIAYTGTTLSRAA